MNASRLRQKAAEALAEHNRLTAEAYRLEGNTDSADFYAGLMVSSLENAEAYGKLSQQEELCRCES